MCRLVLSGLLWCICACLAYGSGECPQGTYRDFGSGNCDPCSDICEYMKIKGTEEDCRKNCPNDFRLNFASKSKSDNKVDNKKTTGKEGSILPVVLPVLAAVVVFSVLLALVVYRRVHVSPRHRPIQPTNQTLVELPSIQCTEESVIDFHEDPIEEQPLPTEEENKFPMAFSDLPFSARHASNLHGSY
ncbi:uncharacterized protein [Haliotis cracherodii]|uniref:uncharacterized protein n=1 Tax=Haliotis cracherodii TaxID=6455 RepID=UPI0039E7FCD4